MRFWKRDPAVENELRTALRADSLAVRKSRRRAVIRLVAALVGLTALAVAARAWQRTLPLRSVRVDGAKLTDERELRRLAAVPTGGKLYDADAGAIARRVERNPFVRRATVGREVPGTLVVQVEERTPVAALRGESGGLLLIDGDGVVLPDVPARQAALVAGLPILSGVRAQPGDRFASGRVRAALALLAALRTDAPALGDRLSEFDLSDSTVITAFTVDGAVPVRFDPTAPHRQVAALDAFWKAVVRPQGAASLAYIDVRYAGQVVARPR